MIQLPESLAAWGTPAFRTILERELGTISTEHLPLQQGLSRSSVVLEGRVEAMVLAIADGPQAIEAMLGVFYSGAVAGCNCSDSDGTIVAQPEYCELRLIIDKTSGQATIQPLPA
jgi:hypothetical protein